MKFFDSFTRPYGEISTLTDYNFNFIGDSFFDDSPLVLYSRQSVNKHGSYFVEFLLKIPFVVLNELL